MEKLLVAHLERLFVVEAGIEPITFRSVVERFTNVTLLHARQKRSDQTIIF
jgi:hypothetical protein